MVSKRKVKDYFDYFKKHNPLFAGQTLNIERIDTWLKELNTNQDHNTHDNDIDPVPSTDTNVVLCNYEGNVPIAISHNVSEEIHLQEKSHEQGRKDDNFVTHNNETNFPIPT